MHSTFHILVKAEEVTNSPCPKDLNLKVYFKCSQNYDPLDPKNKKGISANDPDKVESSCSATTQTFVDFITEPPHTGNPGDASANLQKQTGDCIRCCGVFSLSKNLEEGKGDSADKGNIKGNATCYDCCKCACAKRALPDSPLTKSWCATPTPTPAATPTPAPTNTPQGGATNTTAPANEWEGDVTNNCRTNTTTCSNNVIEQGNADQFRACIRCCTNAPAQESQTCNNYCICECARKANPNGNATQMLCKKPTPSPTPSSTPSTTQTPTPTATFTIPVPSSTPWGIGGLENIYPDSDIIVQPMDAY